MSPFKIRRSAGSPRDLEASGVLPSGHPFTLSVSPWSGSRCTDAPDIRAGFDVDLRPGLPQDVGDAEIEAAIAEANALVEDLDAKLRPLVQSVVDSGGIDEAAVRKVVRIGMFLALERDVPASEVDAAVSADAEAYEARREDYLRPAAQAIWEEAQEYEQGMRM